MSSGKHLRAGFDRNLDEAWMLCLNRLSCFELAGICEGHFGPEGSLAGHDATPFIELRLRNEFLAAVESLWSCKPEVLDQQVRSCIRDAGTRANWGWQGSETGVRQFYVELRFPNTRDSVEMSPALKDWFDGAVASLIALDRSFYTPLNCGQNIEV